MPAPPYKERLSLLSRLICPSAWPLLQSSAMVCLTASMSHVSVLANCCIEHCFHHLPDMTKPPTRCAESERLQQVPSRLYGPSSVIIWDVYPPQRHLVTLSVSCHLTDHR
jgi:hypothetical protein